MKLKFLFIFAIILLVSSKHSLKSKKTSTKIENTVEKTQGSIYNQFKKIKKFKLF